ncbi:MAG: hypothetical protein IPL23_07235 [Saprospiraceae bacterium]|nr:hypothetical protein [Saprospiraceae bacterium]
MSKKVIISIIILMSAALIGLSVIQFLWIRKSLALKEKTFDDRIFITLNMAKEKLLENLQEDIKILGLEKKISTQDERRREQLEYELKKIKCSPTPIYWRPLKFRTLLILTISSERN